MRIKHPILPRAPMATNSSNEDNTGQPKPGPLRGSCDRCWIKKRSCPGGEPCPRCLLGAFECTYSPRKKMGRPTKGASVDAPLQHRQGSPGKSGKKGLGVKKLKQKHSPEKQDTCGREISKWNERCRSFGFRASSSTGLAGLPESHYLSCFLEHCAPM